MNSGEESVERIAALSNEPVMRDLIPMPRTLRVGPYDYTVGEMTPLEHARTGFVGYVSKHRLEIQIYPDGPLQRRQQTLLHEVFHALWDAAEFGQGGSYDEETVVSGLSTAMSQVMRDNPGLMDFLLNNARVPALTSLSPTPRGTRRR